MNTELTDRDKQVLQYIAQGESNQWIANELYLHVRTIGNQIGMLFVKLNARNRAHLVAVAFREGYLS